MSLLYPSLNNTVIDNSLMLWLPNAMKCGYWIEPSCSGNWFVVIMWSTTCSLYKLQWTLRENDSTHWELSFQRKLMHCSWHYTCNSRCICPPQVPSKWIFHFMNLNLVVLFHGNGNSMGLCRLRRNVVWGA